MTSACWINEEARIKSWKAFLDALGALPTERKLADLRARQVDPLLIDLAQETLNQFGTLPEEIERAFDGVMLGEGVGLYGGQDLDDWYLFDGPAQRPSDEKRDWRNLTAAQLNACRSSWSFFDAEGMRFHLPAGMLHELSGEARGFECLGFHLTYMVSEWSRENEGANAAQFALLNAEQRRVVRRFVEYLRWMDEGFDGPRLQLAMEAYWRE